MNETILLAGLALGVAGMFVPALAVLTDTATKVRKGGLN